MDLYSLEHINKWLKDNAGVDPQSQRPIFRVVHSSAQTEMRYGTYRDFSGPVFLREVTELRRVPKYPSFTPCYILEKLNFENGRELVEAADGSYEAIWTFLTKAGAPINPSPHAIQFMIHTIFNPRKLSMKQQMDIIEAELDAKDSQIAEMIEISDHDVFVGYEKEPMSGTDIQ